MAATDLAELVGRYKRYRQVSKRFNSSLTERITKAALHEGGRRLGILQGETLVFGPMDEMAVLMDYCLYDLYEDGLNIVSRFFAEQNPAPGSDAHTVLQALTRAHYTLVQVVEVVPDVGVKAHDLLGNREVLLADLGFSQTAVPGLAVATRLIPFDRFEMTGGAALPIAHGDLFLRIVESLARRLGDTLEGFADLPREEKSAATADIIRISLQFDASSSIRYGQDAERDAVEAPPEPIVREDRPGRNDPCPCGSGRKFKRCCGQAK